MSGTSLCRPWMFFLIPSRSQNSEVKLGLLLKTWNVALLAKLFVPRCQWRQSQTRRQHRFCLLIFSKASFCFTHETSKPSILLDFKCLRWVCSSVFYRFFKDILSYRGFVCVTESRGHKECIFNVRAAEEKTKFQFRLLTSALHSLSPAPAAV